MKFLITTSRKVLLYDNGNIREILNGGVFFGVCKLPGYGYTVLNRNNFNGTGGGNPDSTNRLEFLNENFDYVQTAFLDFIKDGHQITCVDDIIYVTNTGFNVITSLQKTGEAGHIEVYKEVGKDINHINSINFYNNKWWLCQHRMYDKDDGGVAVFDSDWRFLCYYNIGKHAHNAVVKDGHLWSTDSDNGQIIKINLETKERIEYSIAHNLMTRGLIITDDYLVVGLSEFDVREKRHAEKTGQVAFYKYSTMEYVSSLELPGVGQVSDLLLA